MTRRVSSVVAALVVAAGAASSADAGVPDDLRDRLLQRNVAVADAGVVRPAVPIGRALRRARSFMGGYSRDRTHAYLVRFTNLLAGPIDRIAWLIIYRGTEQPILVSPGGTYRADLAIIVDATTARVYFAVTT